MSTPASIEKAIHDFQNLPLDAASSRFWATLGYQSDKRLDLPSDPKSFVRLLNGNSKYEINTATAHVPDWKSAHFLFQLTNDEIPSLAYGHLPMIAGADGYQKGMIESFAFLSIELKSENWTRTQLARMTREINRVFPMPAI